MPAIERSSANYANLSERFTKQGADFSKQYCNVYLIRLKKMTELLLKQIEKKWGATYRVCKLHKLSEEEVVTCVVIGTIFKDQKLKPSILKQLAEANNLNPPPVHSHYTDESDQLFLEDEFQRYQLSGVLDKSVFVTGITCALLGTNLGNGKFNVEDVCFSDFQSQIERPLPEEDIYVIFLSGLDLIHQQKTALSLSLFVDWVSGFLGSFGDIDARKISRVIIAGNSLSLEATATSKSTISLTSRATEAPEAIDAMKVFDETLLELARVVEVDVLPGSFDPANHILPQKPMHHCMFPKSTTYKSLNLVSNPYECEIENVRILGSSGQNVNDILNFSDITDGVDVLENCLKWGHISATSPDTLGCFPFYEEDPFILDCCPHVFFAGNQKSFATKLCKGQEGQMVRIICIPEFANGGIATVLNLKNLECSSITFKNS